MTIKTQGDKEHYEKIDGVSWEIDKTIFNLNFWWEMEKSWSEIVLEKKGY